MDVKKRKKYILIMLLLCGIVVSVLIVHINSLHAEKNKLKNANMLLESILSDSKNQYTQFSTLEQSEMEHWLTSQYGCYMTDEGFHSALESRFLLMGINEYRLSGEEFEIKKIETEKRSGENNAGSWYNYNVVLEFGNQSEKEIYGSFEVVSENGEWLVHNITKDSY